MYRGRVEICGVNTAQLPQMSEEKKVELLGRARQGDADARLELIGGNLRLVLSVVKRFSGRCDSLDDLFQVGCIGLIKAIDNFDLSLDVRFSTYAVPMIIGEVRRYLRDNNSVRVSRSVRDLAYKALGAREAIAKAQGREATEAELAAALSIRGLEVTAAEVGAALEAIASPISLFDPVYGEGGDAVLVMDQLSDGSRASEGWIESIALRQALTELPEREREIISMRFYAGKTQMEIASEIGISQAQVSRLEKGALGRLRAVLL